MLKIISIYSIRRLIKNEEIDYEKIFIMFLVLALMTVCQFFKSDLNDYGHYALLYSYDLSKGFDSSSFVIFDKNQKIIQDKSFDRYCLKNYHNMIIRL